MGRLKPVSVGSPLEAESEKKDQITGLVEPIVRAPFISIIVAVYNGAKTLQQCIDSFARQTYPSRELILIDGGSTDGTLGIIKANSSQIKYWVSESDRGISNAWNKGLLQAKGDWICFLGADDFFWENQALERIGAELPSIPPHVRLVYTQIMLISSGGELLFPVGEPWEIAKSRFKRGFCLPHQGVMHRRSLFEQNGLFDESFRIGADYELMLRELKVAEAIFIPNIIAVAMRQGGLSSNPETAVLALQDIRRAQKMHYRYLPTILWLIAMMKAYMKVLLWKSIGDHATRRLLGLSRRLRGLPSL